MTERPERASDHPLALEEAVARVRAAGGRLTATRRALLEHLHDLDGRCTVDELAVAFPDADVATLYRSLADFEAAGIVEHVHVGHGPSSYRWVGHDTVPIVCAGCGAHVDVPLAMFARLDDELDRAHGFRLLLGHFALTGRCRDCREP